MISSKRDDTYPCVSQVSFPFFFFFLNKYSMISSYSNLRSGCHDLLYPPQTKLREYIVILMSVRSFVCSFIRSFVRSSVRPSQSLIRYSSKTAEQNFMKLSGIVHNMMPYCISYFKFVSA